MISINTEQTTDEYTVALNLDEELTQEMRERLHYGILSFAGSGTVLIVRIPSDSEHLLTRVNIKNLEEKFTEIKADLAEIGKKRQRMLDNIARQTGLPLA